MVSSVIDLLLCTLFNIEAATVVTLSVESYPFVFEVYSSNEKPCHCKKWLILFDNYICHQNWNCDMVLRNDARLVPCDRTMQRMWSTARIEICPYKDPKLIGHFNHIVVTLRLLGYQRLIAKVTCQAAGSDHFTDNPGNIHKVTTIALSWKLLCSWWQKLPPSQLLSGYVSSCLIWAISL